MNSCNSSGATYRATNRLSGRHLGRREPASPAEPRSLAQASTDELLSRAHNWAGNLIFKNRFFGVLTNALALYLLCLPGCEAPRPAVPEKTFLVMGTVASVSLPKDAAADLDRVAELVANTMSDLEKRISVYKPDSEISRINAQAGRSPVIVSKDTFNLLEITKYYCELSDGAFDPTVGPLLRAWGLAGGTPPVSPLTEEELGPWLNNVGWRHIILAGTTALLDKDGVQLDLGGIAKGYAVDVCCHQLLGCGVQNVLIDLGGNIRCLGYARDTEPWVIGIRNPFRPRQILGTLLLSNGQSIATSGNYERFVTIGGRRYAHIVDPQTGRPVQGMAAVTVISHSAAEADALSTTLFVQGMKRGLAILGRTSSHEALFIPDRRPIEIWVTPEFAKRFQPHPSVSNSVFLIDFSMSGQD